MATLVLFHAHPDDEVITTGGTAARAAAEGHRVVLVVATNGDHGEVPDDLGTHETLVDRRRVETERSAAELGIARVEWLGYRDSGMTGWKENHHDGSFLLCDLDEAAGRLASIIVEERADALTTYDWHGSYGHPDHIRVHHVGVRAGLLSGVRVLQATANRDAMVAAIVEASEKGWFDESPDAGDDGEFDPTGPMDDGNPFGEPESVITLAVDVTAYAGQKRRAIGHHRSQVTDTSFMLQMPDEAFHRAFGTEWFIEIDRSPPMRTGWIFEEGD